MVYFCCVPNCNSSGYGENVSMHKFPRDEKVLKAWKDRIRRSTSSSTKGDYTVTEHTRICCKHFNKTDFFYFDTKPRRLRANSIPSIFTWIKRGSRRSPRKRHDSEETDSASEGEDRVHADVQVDLPTPCSHQFSMDIINNSNPRMKLIRFYTGFSNYETFNSVLELIVPDKDRSNIIYWDRRSTTSYTCGTEHFDSDENSDGSDDTDDDERVSQPLRSHKLSVEDEFLLTLMKLKLGLFNKDLAVRFQISLSTVTKIFKTWINLMYLRLGSMKIFPHRDIIIKNMTADFKKQYPKVMLIIDCTELKIEMPSSLVRKSQTYSDYKSTNTFKGLVGVDCRGGIMFVSHLYTGSISDKKICDRSGLFDLLQKKVQNGELHKDDAVMADKGFTIVNELQGLGLRLNIPPFLGKRKMLATADVQDTQVIAHHRIHVERAIGKIKNFHIFDRKFRLKSAGIINQIWTVCCLLSNFQDPLIGNISTDTD